MTRRPLLLSAAALLALTGGLVLSGCSVVDSLVHKQATNTFDDAKTFHADAEVDADWVPDDATAITVRTSTVKDAADAVILLQSAADLADDCVETARTSAPAWSLDDAPSAYEAETVLVCGDWSVIPAADGWLGWTPNSDEEQEAAQEQRG